MTTIERSQTIIGAKDRILFLDEKTVLTRGDLCTGLDYFPAEEARRRRRSVVVLVALVAASWGAVGVIAFALYTIITAIARLVGQGG